MTTTIPSTQTNRTASLSLTSSGDTRLWVCDSDGTGREIVMDTSAVLDAVRSELGVLTINKADLPEVVPGKDGDLTIGGHEGYRREDSDVLPEWSARTESLRALALAEYLEEHPPVDEQQVSNLTQIIDLLGADWASCNESELARRLIATGKVTVQP